MRPQWTYRAEFWRGGTEQGRKISFLARGRSRREAKGTALRYVMHVFGVSYRTAIRNTFTGWHPVRKVPHTPNLEGG